MPLGCPAIRQAGAVTRGRDDDVAALGPDIETRADATDAIAQRGVAPGKPEVESISAGLDTPGWRQLCHGLLRAARGSRVLLVQDRHRAPKYRMLPPWPRRHWPLARSSTSAWMRSASRVASRRPLARAGMLASISAVILAAAATPARTSGVDGKDGQAERRKSLSDRAWVRIREVAERW